MNLQYQVSLLPYNTFRIPSQAESFVVVENKEELLEALAYVRQYHKELLIIGGGSNILFTRDVKGLVLLNKLPGIEIIKEDENHVWVKAGAGVVWHQLVMFAIEHNLHGIENLALIPGSAGAAPMQNIGAYGVELQHVFDYLTAIHIHNGEEHTLTAADCKFGYRESVFKNIYKNQFIITEIVLRLNKNPEFHISYGAIQQQLEEMKVTTLTAKEVAEAVMHIRRSKLPDPAVIGNAGSFFKNPTIDKKQYQALQQQYPSIPGYEVGSNLIKVPAGWLIEHSGPDANTSWKGFKRGDVGCHAKQALVLVNYGNGTGKDVLTLSEDIMQSVRDKYQIDLEREVNLY